MSPMNEEIIWVCQRLDQRQFVANHDGNISARLDGGKFLATPTARGKVELTPHDLIIINEDGEVLEGTGKVFSEWNIHRTIYQAQPDLQCIVHAHPPTLTALGLHEKPLWVDYVPEAVVSLGSEIPCLPILTPNSDDLFHLIKKATPLCVAMMVAGNGIFSFGHDLKTTYYRIELSEHLAGIIFQANAWGDRKPKTLDKNLRSILLKKHGAFIASCKKSTSLHEVQPNISQPEIFQQIVDQVVESFERS